MKNIPTLLIAFAILLGTDLCVAQDTSQTASAADVSGQMRIDELQASADAQVAVGNFRKAAPLYQAQIDLVEQLHGGMDMRLLEPLRNLAGSLLAGKGAVGASRRAMLRRVKITEADASRNPPVYIATLIEYGDWCLLTHNENKGLAAYEQAWRLADAADIDADALFARPVLLSYRAPSMERPERDGAAPYVDAEFSVRHNGQVVYAELTDSTVSSRTRNQVLGAVQRAVYRPRLVNGKRVATRGVSLRTQWSPAGSTKAPTSLPATVIQSAPANSMAEAAGPEITPSADETDLASDAAISATTKSVNKRKASDDLSCRFEKPTGSHRKKMVCMTVGDREKRGNDAREALEQQQHGTSSPP